MAQNSNKNQKLLFICGIICTVAGLIIFMVSLFDEGPVSIWSIGLGVINIINGCLFIGISHQHRPGQESHQQQE